MYQGGSTFLPLRVNQAGVIPIIFAVSILLFPSQIATYFTTSSNGIVEDIAHGHREPGSIRTAGCTSCLYFLLTFGFTYFYTAFTFKPDETADQLRKNGGFIPGIRPGQPDRSDYLARVVIRITPRRRPLPWHRRGRCRRSSRLLPAGPLRPRPGRHGPPDRGLGGRRDDEAARGAAADAQLRGLHPVMSRRSLPRRARRRARAPRRRSLAHASRASRTSPPATCSAPRCATARPSGREARRLHGARAARARRGHHRDAPRAPGRAATRPAA